MNEERKKKQEKIDADENSYNPAFPFHIKLRNKESEEPFRQTVSYGLTKREYFAGIVLQGIMANPKTSDEADNMTPEIIAKSSIIMADALLEELAKKKEL